MNNIGYSVKITIRGNSDLRLGVAHDDYIDPTQFFGSVTNLNIFYLKHAVDENLLSLASSGDASKFIKNMLYLSWSTNNWNNVGNRVEMEYLDENILFSESKELNFRLPRKWRKAQATNECRKYGQGTISKPTELKDVTKMKLENIYGEHFQECNYFWTPFTDFHHEGIFIDENTNETIRYVLH